MKKLLFALTIVSVFSCYSQKGKVFPTIKGKSLDEKAVTLPLKNGKQTIIGIAFHRGAEDALKKWLNPLYYTFIKKEKGQSNFDVSEVYDVNFSFVPMISGFDKLEKDFKAGTQKEFWPYIIDTEKTDVSALQKELGIKDNKIPYFFVLDKDGKVLEVQSGDFSEDKMDKLEEACGE